MSLPDIGLMNRGIALSTTLRIMASEEDSPAKLLLTYWVDLLEQRPVSGSRAAVAPLRFHAAVRAYYDQLSPLVPDGSLVATSPASMAGTLLLDSISASESLRARVEYASGVTWTVFAWLPGFLRDTVWSFAWGVQPTRDRLHSWNITATARCPYCSERETNMHVLFDCRIARIFWNLVRRNTNIVCPVRLNQRHPHRLSVLLTACGAVVLWEARCKAVAQRRRDVPIFGLVRRARIMLINELQRELFALGRDRFLRSWRFHPSLSAQGGCVTIRGTPP